MARKLAVVRSATRPVPLVHEFRMTPLTETIEHATRIAARAESAEQLVELEIPRLELPALPDGVDLGSLYELAEALAQQGVR